MKPIRLSRHAQGYLTKRGFTEAEVQQTIRGAPWHPADWGENRMEASMEFHCAAIWNGRFYTAKKVRPIFVELELEIVVVTVYTYYY